MVHPLNGSSMMWNILRRVSFRRSASKWAQLSQCYDEIPPKVQLMMRESGRQSVIRCGVLKRANGHQSLPTFLGALLADVYASDQTWLAVLLNRQVTRASSLLLIKFGEQFDTQQDGNYTRFAVPSPFLKDCNVEFLEITFPDSKQGEDECHFYIDLSDGSTKRLYRWPTVTVNDTTSSDPLPLSNQVNSSMAAEGILKFIRDKSSVSSYLQAMDRSNMSSFADRLKHKIHDRKKIFSDLGMATLKNLMDSDESLIENHISESQKQEMIRQVEGWRRQAHEELQSEVLPLLQKFLKSHLSIWRIYSYSEDKFNLRLKELVDKPLRDLKMVNLLYSLRGKLQLEGSINSPLHNAHLFEKEVTLAHRDLNKVIYQNFFKLQLPLIVCSTMGYVSEQFSLYSMGALASLGIVLGLQRVISSWELASKKIVDNIYDAIRTYIEYESNFMIQQCNEKFAEDETKHKHKQEILNSLLQDLRK